VKVEGLRQGLYHLYRRLKRNKALPGMRGWDVAALDGHESHASYRRHCSGCLQRIVHLGHARWDIENHGFNELVNGWHADHLYKHEPNALEAFFLTTFLACNLFHAWLTRNLKTSVQRGKTQAFWAHLMAAKIYRTAAPLIHSP
jgi:hypothetical protein